MLTLFCKFRGREGNCIAIAAGGLGRCKWRTGGTCKGGSDKVKVRRTPRQSCAINTLKHVTSHLAVARGYLEPGWWVGGQVEGCVDCSHFSVSPGFPGSINPVRGTTQPSRPLPACHSPRLMHVPFYPFDLPKNFLQTLASSHCRCLFAKLVSSSHCAMANP